MRLAELARRIPYPADATDCKGFSFVTSNVHDDDYSVEDYEASELIYNVIIVSFHSLVFLFSRI